jgi:hypothetical protein
MHHCSYWKVTNSFRYGTGFFHWRSETPDKYSVLGPKLRSKISHRSLGKCSSHCDLSAYSSGEPCAFISVRTTDQYRPPAVATLRQTASGDRLHNFMANSQHVGKAEILLISPSDQEQDNFLLEGSILFKFWWRNRFWNHYFSLRQGLTYNRLSINLKGYPDSFRKCKKINCCTIASAMTTRPPLEVWPLES